MEIYMDVEKHKIHLWVCGSQIQTKKFLHGKFKKLHANPQMNILFSTPLNTSIGPYIIGGQNLKLRNPYRECKTIVKTQTRKSL